MKKVGRNDVCPCGSGKKYKNCHGIKAMVSRQGNKIFWMIGILIVLFISAIYGLFNKSEENGSTRPEGQAPVGKVWSAAHGHWHDA
jgi:hypothetical protein